MSRINFLDSLTYNQIAAGEVIERPASVVKELVENSLDAGASEISIFVSNGGKKIRIVDNGIGMDRTDAENAFKKHATSKIVKTADLDQIKSFGFRGEALASIASVSMVTMSTKNSESEVGTEISLKGGEVIKISQSPIEVGTDLLIENLFFNTPVREKFLKKDSREEGEITTIVEKLILANPYVAFNYFLNDKLIYTVTGKNLESAVYAVFSKEFLDNSHYINTVKGRFSIKGYFSKIDFVKGNRTYQNIFLNGRYIKNDTISQAINAAYKPHLMTKTFPFFVIHIHVEPEFIDVNVSPTKMEIRFQNSSLVYGTIYKLINDMLKDDITLDYMAYEEETPYDPLPDVKSNIVTAPLEDVIAFAETIQEDEVGISFNSIDVLRALRKKEAQDDEIDETPKGFESTFDFLKNICDENFQISQFEKDILREKQREFGKSLNLSKIKIIGTLFSTYILVEDEDKFLLIDQHAGHERILYEDYRQELLNDKLVIQKLLIPIELRLNEEEKNFLCYNFTQFKNLGFEIENIDTPVLQITAVPQRLAGINFERFLGEAYESFHDAEGFTFEQLSMNLMKKACKHAVKAGDALSIDEINALLEKLTKEVELRCPHGRPIIITLTKKEVEKWFKRIV